MAGSLLQSWVYMDRQPAGSGEGGARPSSAVIWGLGADEVSDTQLWYSEAVLAEAAPEVAYGAS